MAGPLDGIRVIDLSNVVSGPLAGMMLADQGADVIKVEAPAGDMLRAGKFSRGGLNAFTTNTNRGKRSIAVDLQNPRGQELVRALVKTADVFLQNFRPGAVERLGLSEPDLRAMHPDLIYVSISGFGDSGPYADRRVYDPIIQGMTGHTAVQVNPLTTFRDLVRNVVCDKATAYTAAQAISAALFARERGAGGQHIRIPMVDAGLAFFWPDGMLKHTLLEEDVEPGVALYDVYRLTQTADGQLIYFIATLSEFHGLYRALNRHDLLEDERFQPPGIAPENLAILGKIFEEEFAKWETEEITQRLVEEQVPVGPVLEIEEIFEDPQVVHNNVVVERNHPSAGRIREARPAAHFDGTPTTLPPLAPLLGEHTDEILTDLGLHPDEIQKLRDDGILPV